MLFCGSTNRGITETHSVTQGPEYNSQHLEKKTIHGITSQKFKAHRERCRKKIYLRLYSEKV